MKNIECKCKSCKLEYIYQFDEEALCQPCFMKVLTSRGYEKKLKQVAEEANITIKKAIKWREIKKFTYALLFLLPFPWYIGFAYGIRMQILSGIIIVLSLFIDPLSDWLSDKF